MAGVRDAIRMTDEEVDAFLAGELTLIAATNGHDGFPHLMPLWFVVRESGLWSWTYARSQKARNLERDPRATVQVEAGTAYEELRGVMLRCEVRLHRDHRVLEGLATELLERYADPAPEDLAAARAAYASQIPKRVGLEFVETGRRVTWDHRKLAAL
jgi:general stress protein 26